MHTLSLHEWFSGQYLPSTLPHQHADVLNPLFVQTSYALLLKQPLLIIILVLSNVSLLVPQ